jgi:hypothetical protein
MIKDVKSKKVQENKINNNKDIMIKDVKCKKKKENNNKASILIMKESKIKDIKSKINMKKITNTMSKEMMMK